MSVRRSVKSSCQQVYAVLAVVDTMPLEGFNTVIGSGAWRAANNAMLVQCRVIASNELVSPTPRRVLRLRQHVFLLFLFLNDVLKAP